MEKHHPTHESVAEAEGTSTEGSYDQAWSDPRYRFWYELSDPKTGERCESLLGVLAVDREYLRRCGILRSGLLEGLREEGRRAVLWLCQQALILKFKKRFLLSKFGGLQASDFRRLQGIIAAVGGIAGRLIQFRGTVRGMNILHGSVLGGLALHDYLDNAISSLIEFSRKARIQHSRSADISYFKEYHLDPYWPLRPPALSYGLLRLLREHTHPQVKADVAYNRIGDFEREILGCKVGDSVEVVRRQVRRFKKSNLKVEIDGLLKRLLTSEWFGESRTISQEGDNSKPVPPSPRRKMTRDKSRLLPQA